MTVTAPRVQLRYGDKVLESGSGGVHRHLNPYTGQVQAEIPLRASPRWTRPSIWPRPRPRPGAAGRPNGVVTC